MIDAARSSRLLIRALGAYLGDLSDLDARSRAWASITFVGYVHLLNFTLAEEGGLADKVAALDSAELPMGGQFVASIAVKNNAADSLHRRVQLEVLTLSDS